MAVAKVLLKMLFVIHLFLFYFMHILIFFVFTDAPNNTLKHIYLIII